MTKAAAIAYRNLTFYLTPNSNYADAREGSIAAAEELQDDGILTALDVEEVVAAWCAVGVDCGTPPPDDDNPPSGTCNRLIDSLALVAFYNSTNGPNWTNTWNLNQPMDTWYGIDLYENGCVRCIDMDGNPNCNNNDFSFGNNLVGSLPTEIGDLSSLEHLFKQIVRIRDFKQSIEWTYSS